MRNTLRKAAHVLVAGLLLANATAQEACTSTRTVTASGYASEGAEGDTALRQSLAQALAAAVAQANGTLVQHQTSIETTITTRLGNDARTEDTLDEFRETIEQTTAGFITSFEILNETEEHALKRIDILAEVCTDPRATLSFKGNRTATGAIEAAILPHLQAGGWRVSVTGSYFAPDRAMDAFYETGGTLLLDVTAKEADSSQYRGLRHIDLEVSGTLTDLRSQERSQAYALTTEGIGTTREAALHDAGARAASELTRIFQATWALEQGINASGLDLGFDEINAPATLTFTGVTRPNTRYEIEDLIEGTPAITTEDHLAWDEDAQTLTLRATLSGNPCDIAASLENARRILIRTHQCSEQAITLNVQRE